MACRGPLAGPCRFSCRLPWRLAPRRWTRATGKCFLFLAHRRPMTCVRVWRTEKSSDASFRLLTLLTLTVRRRMSTLSPPPLPPRTPSGKVVGPTTAQSPSPDGGRRVPPALPARPEASSTDPDTVVLVEDKRLVDALSNDELGVLMRRFDKVSLTRPRRRLVRWNGA